MNLTAHPLTVAAELAWKRESLGGANLGETFDRGPRRPRRWLRVFRGVPSTTPAAAQRARHA